MKIGFLALSGLRVQDPELIRLGLTMPGVIERGKVVGTLPSLGLLFLAGATPPGHSLHYFEAEGDGKEPAEVYTCDLVAISTFSAQVYEAYAIADRLRLAGVRVAMGGLHVSVRADEARRHADHVFIGEGEASWPQAVRDLERGLAQPLYQAEKFPPIDAGHLPSPRYDLLTGRPYSRFPVQTSRGCPWRCDFCASNVMLRQPYRKRPVAVVRRDIERIIAMHPKPFIEFADDNTFVDKAWGKALCREIDSLGVHWFTETDITVADDEELLALMRASGCRQVLIGLESPEPAALDGVELRANFKAKRWAGCMEAVRRIQEHGITVNGCFILGLDGHTPAIFEQVLEFARAAPLYDVQITVLTPFPGTPLYDRLHAEGRLTHPERWDRCTLFDVNYLPRQMSPDQLRQGMAWLTERLYSDAALEERRRPYFENLWKQRGVGRSTTTAITP